MAGALLVLFDGAVAAAEHDGPRRAHQARWIAEQLLALEEPRRRSPSQRRPRRRS